MVSPERSGEGTTGYRFETQSSTHNENTENEFQVVWIRCLDHPAQLEVMQGKGEVPYFVIRWPAPNSKQQALEIIRNYGESFSETEREYVCSTPGPKSFSYCGTLSAEEQRIIDEAKGISPNLERVFKDDFTLLRVDAGDLAIVWQSQDILPRHELIGIITSAAEVSLTNPTILDAMEKTLPEELRASTLDFLVALEVQKEAAAASLA